MKIRVMKLVKSYKELENKMEEILMNKEIVTSEKYVQTITDISALPVEMSNSFKLECLVPTITT